MTRHRRVSLLGVEGGADSCKKRPPPKKTIAHWVSVPAYNTAGENLLTRGLVDQVLMITITDLGFKSQQ